MTPWPRWNRVEDPAALTRYVRRGVVRRLLDAPLARDLPGHTGRDRRRRVRDLYEVFARRGIGYVLQDPTSGPGGQPVRTPDHVLLRPGQGTCLDLAVLFAGACLDAALHPVIVVTEPRTPEGSGHALVVVWLDGEWNPHASDYPLAEQVHRTAPEEIIGDLCEDEDTPGAFFAVDITLATRGYRGREPGTWAEALASGAEELSQSSPRSWGVGVDVGNAHHLVTPLALPEWWPSRPVIIPAYPTDTGKRGPLGRLWARRGVVPFRSHDIFEVLKERAVAGEPGRPLVVIAHGAGGAGKTRTAAEIAKDLDGQGWYAGFLRRDVEQRELTWLQTVQQPLLVVVDYAETGLYDTRVEQRATERTDDLVLRLLGELQDREQPTCLLLTARGDGGWWEHSVGRTLDGNGYRYDVCRRSFPDLHPSPRRVFGSAFRAFADSTLLVPEPDESLLGEDRWTTLDLVMHAWLIAQGESDRPSDPGELYELVLGRELDYWNDVFKERFGRRLSRDLLRLVAARVSLAAPAPERLEEVLARVPGLRTEPGLRGELSDLLREVLPFDPGERGLAVRPDPVGDHLVAVTMTEGVPAASRNGPLAFGRTGTDPSEVPVEDDPPDTFRVSPLFEESLADADPADHTGILQAVTRSAQTHPARAAVLAQATLSSRPELWRPALSVATTLGGPYQKVLRDLAEREDPAPLDLAEIADLLPFGHTTVAELARIAAERTAPPPPSRDAPPAKRVEHARLLGRLAHRNRDVGRYPRALNLARQRVDLLRELHEGTAGRTYLLELVEALHDLAVHLGDHDERDEAVEAARQAYDLHRCLTSDQVDENTGRGAVPLLLTLADALFEAGDHEQALLHSARARAFQGPLPADASHHLRSLTARSLNNRALQLLAGGNTKAAVGSAEEAVTHYRRLDADNPAEYRASFADALCNLASLLAETGEDEDSVEFSREALELQRELFTEGSPSRRAALARALEVRSQALGVAEREQEALDHSLEAVGLRRRLARELPHVHLAPLAEHLGILGTRRLHLGAVREAEKDCAEAVRLHRSLAKSKGEHASASGLVGALGNHALCLYDLDRVEEGLTAAREAARICRDRQGRGIDAATTAIVGHTLATGLEWAKEYEEAQTVVEEALQTLGRWEDHPGESALLLHMLADLRAERGERAKSVTAAIASAGLYRGLAQDHPRRYRIRAASALNSLSIALAGNGADEEALDVAWEVADLYAELVHEGLVHAKEEALALNNLAVRLTDVGSIEKAIEIAESAVDAYRDLFEDAPSRYAFDLARALGNLATPLAESFRQDEAAAAAKEAADLYRHRAEEEDTREELAMVLSTLAGLDPVPGQEGTKVDQRKEAVDLYRSLERDRPGAHRSDLAQELSGLASALAGAGRGDEALPPLDEAIDVARALHEAEPDAHASLLGNLLSGRAKHLVDLDRPGEATAPISEALELHLDLASDQPHAQLTNLINTLLIHGEIDDAATDKAIARALRMLPPGAGARLLAYRSSQQGGRGHVEAAVTTLNTAAALIEQEDDLLRRGMLRRMVRGLLDELPAQTVSALADLPPWAHAPWSTKVGAVLEKWGESDEWSDREVVLRRHHRLLNGRAGRKTRKLARLLYPGNDELVELDALLARVKERGFTEVAQRERDDHRHAALVQEWVSSKDWQQTYDVQNAHPELIDDPRTRVLLRADPENPAHRQHLDLLDLLEVLPAIDVYEALLDQEEAGSLVTRLVEEGETTTLGTLMRLLPESAELTFIGAYARAVLAVSDDCDPDRAGELIDTAVAQAEPDQVQAGAIRLRRLATGHPRHGAVFMELADRLARSHDRTSAGGDPSAGS